MKTRLLLHSLSNWAHPNLRNWEPDDPTTIAEIVTADIGHRSRSGSDSFSIRVATPAGLTTLEARQGILATRPLLIMQSYSYEDLWCWFESVVRRCDAEDWNKCVDKLRFYFDWEYEDYNEN